MKAILVSLNLNNYQDTVDSVNELESLCHALDISVVDKVIQNSDKVYAKYYVGTGKVLEIKKAIEILDADLVVFDDPLTPSQLKNLEEALDCAIYDRSFLILQIFANRAKTKEAILEVNLALKLYSLPRISSLNKGLSRQGGGSFNAKGAGETKLELDRRKILEEIGKIKYDLNNVKKVRINQRKSRLASGIPIVALVGYTNAGKSSLFNSLTEILEPEKDLVLEKDMLFATLDTKTRKLQKKDYPPFLLIDTVGFVNKLPHELVNSFESTLSDIIDADLIIHVVNGQDLESSKIETTKVIIDKLGCHDINRLMVLTRKDNGSSNVDLNTDYLWVSNKNKENIDLLIDNIYGSIYPNLRLIEILIPFDKGNMVNKIKQSKQVIKLEYLENGIKLVFLENENRISDYSEYLVHPM